MKKLIFAVFAALMIGVPSLLSQATTPQDTTIYDAPESLPYPLLKSCALDIHPGWTADSARTCGEFNLMRLMSQNIVYPYEARDQNLQGTIVAQLIIEPTGRMSHINIIKDIGGGCGNEALRVLKLLDTLGLRWQPGMNAGKPIRARKALPFRFRLTEALPYIINQQGDTIYNNVDIQPAFKFGNDSLYSFIINSLDYPENFEDSCKTGIIEYSLIVHPSGRVKVENQIDFNNLGSDFQFNGIRLANRTTGMWQPATYKEKPVPSTLPFRVVFHSDAEGCKASNDKFDQAMRIADEGVALNEAQQTKEAIQKFTEALLLDPTNTEILYYRGTLLLNEKQNEAACVDYNQIRVLLGYTWFEQIRRLVCGYKE